MSDMSIVLSSDSLQTETQSPRHGGESVAEVLRAHGVKYVFTLVGGHISPILVACEKMGIRIVDTRHEATAVFAADAVARLSGLPEYLINSHSQFSSYNFHLQLWRIMEIDVAIMYVGLCSCAHPTLQT